MKAIEIKHTSIMNELVKLNARLEKAQKNLEKKMAIAEKLGVADWTNEEHYEWMQTIETNNGWIVNKSDIKKNGAWFDVYRAKSDVTEIQRSIANAEKRFAQAEAKLNEYHAELERIANLKEKEELRKLEFEAEQKEWAKDGITLDGRYYGTTPNGKKFIIYGNNGFTLRSWHCVTLRIDGETIFTSGEFWRAYGVVKNS